MSGEVYVNSVPRTDSFRTISAYVMQASAHSYPATSSKTPSTHHLHAAHRSILDGLREYLWCTFSRPCDTFSKISACTMRLAKTFPDMLGHKKCCQLLMAQGAQNVISLCTHPAPLYLEQQRSCFDVTCCRVL